MKTRHFINLVEVLKGLREDLMVGIFVSHWVFMQYNWHSFVATHVTMHMSITVIY